LRQCPDIESMSNTYRISGQTGFLTSLMRGLFLAVAAIGGFFMLAFSAAFAFFVVVGLVLVGLVVFGFLWARAKLFGKPFGPKAQFEAARKDMEAQFQTVLAETAMAPLSMPTKRLKVGLSTINLPGFNPSI